MKTDNLVRDIVIVLAYTVLMVVTATTCHDVNELHREIKNIQTINIVKPPEPKPPAKDYYKNDNFPKPPKHALPEL